MTEKEQTLYAGTCLGTCEAATSVVTAPINIETEDQAEPVRLLYNGDVQLPPPLQNIVDGSADDLDRSQREKLKAFLKKNRQNFIENKGELGRAGAVKHEIFTGDAAPIKQPPRRFPAHKGAAAEAEIENMISQGVIEESCSPWASPVVLVTKKDGSLRFCIDYRKLNQVTRKDSFPLPRIDQTLEALGGSEWFSTLDLASGYWQVQMDPADAEKTAFATEKGMWQFKVMPFGVCNGPATFQRLMEMVLRGLHWTVSLVYLNDIICHSRDFDTRLAHLQEIFDRLRAAGLKLSPKKCNLFQRQVEFLGHVISKDGVATDPQKTAAIREWPVPKSVTEVRSFLGLCSYYRRFIRGFADIARPLHRLTEKAAEFLWTEDCQQAMDQLKDALTSAPILSFPGAFILDTDASSFGIGAVLLQIQDQEEKVITYYSRSLTKPERNYCVIRKELLAVVEAVKHCHHYLYGGHFRIRTDHGALRWLLSFKSPEGQVARWIEMLGTYNLEIEHRMPTGCLDDRVRPKAVHTASGRKNGKPWP